MKKELIFSVFFIIVGLLVAVAPFTFFPVCPVHGGMVMKCYWTARFELILGILTAGAGVVQGITVWKKR